jgi:twitching motility protein PilI
MSDTSHSTAVSARKNRLQEYQAMLARKLRDARTQPATEGYLGLQICERHWLLSLAEAGEVLDLQAPTPVPLTQPWYAGLINARGNLVGVIDFARFCGGDSTPTTPSVSKIVVLSKHPDRACGILVSRVLGLRSAGDLQAQQLAVEGPASWEGRSWKDADGRDWRELDVRRLLNDPAFLQVGRQAA